MRALTSTCMCALVFPLVTSLRRRTNARKAGGPNVENIACPVLAALIKNEVVIEDEYGRVDQNDTTYGLMQTGNSYMMALFQSKGIAGFNTSDIHQNIRIKFSSDSDRWLNYRIMNAQDACSLSAPNIPAGNPCNANPEFQQHGYSTLLRDPDGGSARERFDAWFERPGVLTYTLGDGHLGRTMTLEGLATLLAYARQEGDWSGEFSRRKLAEFHPSITSDFNISAVSAWQAVTAWASFWAAFAQEKNGYTYMTYDELYTWFVEGDFPSGWVVKPWGFRETFAAVCGMRGSGAGDEWCDLICNLLDTYGWDASEETYFYQMIEAIGSIGAREDDIYRVYS